MQGSLRVTDTTYSTNINLASATASQAVVTDANKNLISKGITDNASSTALGTSDTNLVTARSVANAGYVKSSGVTSITIQTTSPITGGSSTATTGTGSYTIAHDTSDGNKHVPATGTSNNGKFLKAGSTAGSLSWGTAVTSVQVQATSPLTSSTNTAQTSTLNTTIAFSNQNANTILAGPSSGNAAAPGFRALVAGDIPNLSWNKITSDKPTTLSGYGITDAAEDGHTHTLSLATDSGTSNVVSLSAATTYKLIAGGSSILLKTPADTTVIHQLYHATGNVVADSAVYRYQLLFHTARPTNQTDYVTPLNNVSNGYNQTNKTMLTGVAFDPFDEIYYYSSTSTAAAGAVFGYNTLLFATGSCDLRYTFNITSSANLLANNKLVYLKTIPQSDGTVKLAPDSVPVTTTLPTFADDYWYILLGRSGTNGYVIALYPNHPVFFHDGTSLKRVLPQDAGATHENAGLMSAADKYILDDISGNSGDFALWRSLSITIPANTSTYYYYNSFITANTWIVSTNLSYMGFCTTNIDWVTSDGCIMFNLGKTLSSSLTFTCVALRDYVINVSN